MLRERSRSVPGRAGRSARPTERSSSSSPPTVARVGANCRPLGSMTRFEREASFPIRWGSRLRPSRTSCCSPASTAAVRAGATPGAGHSSDSSAAVLANDFASHQRMPPEPRVGVPGKVRWSMDEVRTRTEAEHPRGQHPAPPEGRVVHEHVGDPAGVDDVRVLLVVRHPHPAVLRRVDPFPGNVRGRGSRVCRHLRRLDRLCRRRRGGRRRWRSCFRRRNRRLRVVRGRRRRLRLRQYGHGEREGEEDDERLRHGGSGLSPRVVVLLRRPRRSTHRGGTNPQKWVGCCLSLAAPRAKERSTAPAPAAAPAPPYGFRSTLLRLMFSTGPAWIPPFCEMFRSKVVPMSALPVFDVLISRSSHSRTSFFSACSSTSPSFASMRNFFAFTSKVTVRFPDMSPMMIFSSPFLSEITIW